MTDPSISKESSPGIFRPARLVHLLAAMFFVYLFFLSLRPLGDADVWWHLKTGQLIVQTHELPGNRDLFSYTTPNPIPADDLKGLRGQWLGQVMLYLAYAVGGYAGLSIFRSLLIVLPFLIMYVFYVRKGASPFMCLMALGFPPFAITLMFPYAFERPQAFSFILLPVMYALLERLRQGKAWAGWALPLLMLAWVNIHGAAFVGMLVICAYVMGLLVALAAGRAGISSLALDVKRPVIFIVGIGASALAFLSNPNGYFQISGWVYRAYYLMKGMVPGGSGGVIQAAGHAGGINSSSPVLAEVLEYKSLLYFYDQMGYPWPLYMAAYIVVALCTLGFVYAIRRKVDIPMAVVSLLVSGLGLYYVKGTNFALMYLGFALGRASLSIKGDRRAVIPGAVLAVLLAAMTATAVRTSPWELKPEIPRSWTSQSYPVRALEFMKDKRIDGPVFNDMRWGGYIIWDSWPEYMVFMDSRTVTDASTNMYIGVMKGSPAWRNILGAYNVNVLLIPVMSMDNGAIFPILLQMAMDEARDWRLVYLADNVAVLVKNAPKNEMIIKDNAIPYVKLHEAILGYTELMMMTQPENPNLMFNKGLALYGLKRYDEARQILSAMPVRMGITDELLRRMQGK